MTEPFSVVIPVYNEQAALGSALHELQEYLNQQAFQTEVIVVDDGSQDQTATVARSVPGVRLVQHPHNRGYGAALKTGMSHACHNWVLCFDGDGQFPVEHIATLAAERFDADMVVGSRATKDIPWIRRPGKFVLHFLANYLSQRKIPDLNSGFRFIKKTALEPFRHLLPDTFSFSTTSTLALHRTGSHVKFIPISMKPRTSGTSMVGIKHAVRMFFLILRTIAVFSPLRVFMPPAMLLFLFATISLLRDIIEVNITDTSILLFVSALIMFFFGILADQIVLLRESLHKNIKHE